MKVRCSRKGFVSAVLILFLSEYALLCCYHCFYQLRVLFAADEEHTDFTALTSSSIAE